MTFWAVIVLCWRNGSVSHQAGVNFEVLRISMQSAIINESRHEQPFSFLLSYVTRHWSCLLVFANPRISSPHNKTLNLLMFIAKSIITIGMRSGEISSHSCVSCRLQLYFAAWWKPFFLCFHISSTSSSDETKKKRTVKVVLFCECVAADETANFHHAVQKASDLIDAKKIPIIKFGLLLVISFVSLSRVALGLESSTKKKKVFCFFWS